MNKITKMFIALIGACSIVLDILTPLVVAIVIRSVFYLSPTVSSGILIIGGLGTLFRGIKSGGWLKNE